MVSASSRTQDKLIARRHQPYAWRGDKDVRALTHGDHLIEVVEFLIHLCGILHRCGDFIA